MLERFGFTPTETRVYQTLLGLGPSTGYAVALELGVARANVYQALESLVRRGAARKSATTPVQYAAAGPSALLGELERSFRRDLTELEDSLRALPISAAGGQTSLEHLTSADQLLARASSCVDVAATELLAVTGPWAGLMQARFPAAIARGVQLRVVALGEPAPHGTQARPVPTDQLEAYWGGLPLAVVADRTRAVFGVLLSDESASGIATSAPGAIPFVRHLLRREFAGA